MFALFALAHAEDLYVSSNERGAAILLNGVDTGFTTPATITGVKPGRTLVSVESGCSRGEAVVDVLAGLTTRASIVATEQLGTLSIIPVPPSARIELDNAPFQGAPGVPLAVSCGDHTVRASLEGHVPAIVTVEVGMGQDLTVPINLQKLGLGTLELSVSPRSATIYVDNKPVGSDAVTLPSVYQGVHTISAELDGYQSARKQVVVEDGSAQAWHFELVRTSQKKQTSTATRLGGAPEATATSGQGAGGVEAIEARESARRESDARAASERAAAERAAEEREAEEREAEEREAEAAAQERAAADARARKASSDRAASDRAASDRAAADRAAAAREAEEREAEEREAADRAAEREAEEREAEEREAAEREAEEREAEEREAKREREAEAAREKKAAADRRATVDTKARVENDGPPVGKTVAGIGLLAGGVGGGIYSVLAFDSASRAYESYAEKVEVAGGDKQRQRLADEYYDETVAPRQAMFYGSAIGSGLFLAGGVVVLVIDDRAPILVPAPGGGMLLWSGRF